MGATITRIATFGSWPQVASSIEIMLLDDRVDAFCIDWVDQRTKCRRSSLYSLNSLEEFCEISKLMGKKLQNFSSFTLCKGADVQTDSGTLRIVRVIAE